MSPGITALTQELDNNMLIAFIGGGNMATALISGLSKKVEQGLTIRVAEPSEEARARLQSSFDVFVSSSAASVAQGADVIVLAVKPQVLPAVLSELSGTIEPGQLVLSIAAGATIAAISQQLGPRQVIIRSMPNTPALVGEGISVLCAGEHCRPHHRDQAERILHAAGEVLWVDDETLMDAVTAVSGSGPAYFFLLTEALAEAGVRLGLKEDVAHKLAECTCIGAGAMLKQSTSGQSTTVGAAELRQRVTSPGGTTQAALNAFADGKFKELVYAAAAAAERRGNELSLAAAARGPGK
ncbi:MAG: pyrroline-5-carboxylate reductase [Xanthomonadales bacterium]|nr:pyrroline-5-carboxylate reductase [Xanthomonadales bacterium]